MCKTVQDHQTALINQLISARQAVLTQCRALAPEQQDEVFLGSWCSKDLLAHLTRWDWTNLQAFQEIAAGQYPAFFQYYDKDWQSYNAQLVQQHRIEPFEALIAQAEESHQALIGYLKQLPAEIVVRGKAKNLKGRTVTIHNLIRSEAHDESQHAEEMILYFQSHPLQFPV